MAIKDSENTLEFHITSIFNVQQLSSAVRQKWERAALSDGPACSCSLERILQRQRAAEEKRLKRQQRAGNRLNACKVAGARHEELRLQRVQELEDKLAVAEARRSASLEAIRLRAKVTGDRSIEAAERLSMRNNQKIARLEAKLAKLEQADKSRQSQRSMLATKRSHPKLKPAAASQPAHQQHHKQPKAAHATQPKGDLHDSPERDAPVLRFMQRRSSRVVQRSWRGFVQGKRTTAELARVFISTGLPVGLMAVDSDSHSEGQHAGSAQDSSAAAASPAVAPIAFIGGPPSGDIRGDDDFERFAAALRSEETLRASVKLLRRLALKLQPAARAPAVDPLLRHLFPRARKPDRYPARVFLCAFMILEHPQVVFSKRSEREAALSHAAAGMVSAFRKLLERLSSRRPASRTENKAGSSLQSAAQLLAGFDAAWLAYLEQFVAWKTADAANLEGELIKVAVDMEVSLLAKLSGAGNSSPRQSPQDREALVEQVARDHGLLRERIQRLGGQAALTRLEARLAAARAAAAASPPPGTPPQSPGRETRTTQTSPSTPPPPERAAASIGNEGLAWELLYNARFQLPAAEAEAAWRDATGVTNVMQEQPPQPQGDSAEQIAEQTATRVRRIAEAAFWDSLADAEPEHLARLLGDLAAQLAEALPSRSSLAAEVRQRMHQPALLECVATGGVEGLLPALETLARLLREAGSPEREAAALAAYAEIQQQVAAGAGSPVAVRAALVRALRLLAAQLRLLQLDMSNASLCMLAASLGPSEGFRYVAQKFAERHELANDADAGQLAQKLPHTRSWLAHASGQLPGLPPPSARVHQAAAAVPSEMHTGRGAAPSVGGEQTLPKPAAAFVEDVRPGSWRGLVRIGLVTLVCTDQQLSLPPPPPPETLSLDAVRLHAAKEAFQRLLVLATCLLLTQQSAATAQRPAPDAAALKPRLEALLGSDDVGLSGLAAELAAACHGAPDAEAEAAMTQALQRMLSRGSAGFKALSGGLAKVLQQMLLGGGLAEEELTAQLARFGAGSLMAEAWQLVERLKGMAAVSEAVHAQTYEKLAAGLL